MAAKVRTVTCNRQAAHAWDKPWFRSTAATLKFKTANVKFVTIQLLLATDFIYLSHHLHGWKPFFIKLHSFHQSINVRIKWNSVVQNSQPKVSISPVVVLKLFLKMYPNIAFPPSLSPFCFTATAARYVQLLCASVRSHWHNSWRVQITQLLPVHFPSVPPHSCPPPPLWKLRATVRATERVSHWILNTADWRKFN
jgi:hypothetical protein